MIYILIIFLIILAVFSTFFKAVKNIIVYILENLGLDRKTIDFIFSIIIVVLILSLFV